MEYIVVFVTAPDEESAAKISRSLVEERLAGCVNIIRGVRSVYRWEGRVEDDTEVLMVIKCRRSLFKTLEGRVMDLHPYDLPEVIALPVTEGSEEYLRWLNDATAYRGNPEKDDSRTED